MNEEHTYSKHDCNDWTTATTEVSRKYVRTYCSYCGKTTGFRWKSFWKRLLNLIK